MPEYKHVMNIVTGEAELIELTQEELDQRVVDAANALLKPKVDRIAGLFRAAYITALASNTAQERISLMQLRGTYQQLSGFGDMVSARELVATATVPANLASTQQAILDVFDGPELA